MDAHGRMIFRISAKLAKKIHLDYDQLLPPSANPFLDWSAHLFTADRTQYILITNTATLYSMVIYGKGVTHDSLFLRDTIAAIRDVLEADGFSSVLQRVIGPAAYQVTLAKRQNRSVIGSMNDLIYQARLRLIEQGFSPYDTSFYLNDVPMSYIDYQSPREAFRSMVQKHPAG